MKCPQSMIPVGLSFPCLALMALLGTWIALGQIPEAVAQAPAAAQSGSVTIRRGSVGSISIGMSEQTLISLIPAGRRRLVDLQLEGEPSPAYELTLPGLTTKGGIAAELEGDVGHREIYTITIDDPGAKTEKGIGVGSTISQVRVAYPDVQWEGAAEGSWFVTVESLGVSLVDLLPGN